METKENTTNRKHPWLAGIVIVIFGVLITKWGLKYVPPVVALINTGVSMIAGVVIAFAFNQWGIKVDIEKLLETYIRRKK